MWETIATYENIVKEYGKYEARQTRSAVGELRMYETKLYLDRVRMQQQQLNASLLYFLFFYKTYLRILYEILHSFLVSHFSLSMSAEIMQ